MTNENYPNAVNVDAPNTRAVEFVAAMDPPPKTIAEIGVYRGHTSREFARMLQPDGELHLYDFESTVEQVVTDLRKAGYDNVVGHGNSKKVLDSYNWSLMKMLRDHTQPIYDYVFLDGAHTWAHDALAFFLVDRLLKRGGFLHFDDYHWTLASSPSLNPDTFPKTAEWYPPEQIEAKQVKLVVDLLVRRDERYEEVVENGVFRKSSAWSQS